jgi:hypothetical protein
MHRKKKPCMECGEPTEGTIIKDPNSLIAIFIDIVCENCVEEVFHEMEGQMEIVRERTYPGAKEAVERLPEYVEPIEPPLGWNGEKEYIEGLYEMLPQRGERAE